MAPDSTKIYRIFRDYFEKLYANKFESVEETDKFIDTYALQILNQEDTKISNRYIASNDIDAATVSQERKTQDQIVNC
jgi:hypothetical protein